MGTSLAEASNKKTTDKPASKPRYKPNKAAKKSARTLAPQPPRNTADNTVIDTPPAGSSATRLPPVKAPDLPTVWQGYTLQTQITLHPNPSGTYRIWLPLPAGQDTLYQQYLGYTLKSNADNVTLHRLPDGEQDVLVCQWSANPAPPELSLSSRINTAERHFDITRRSIAPEREDILRRHLRATETLPNDGPVYDLAMRIIGRIKDPVAQAKALFDWITDNAVFLPNMPAGGNGNAYQQIQTGRLGGGSIDISALFVSLCRSLGIPARCVFGLRLGASGISELLSVGNAQQLEHAQHCRAEFYVPGYSWIPVDPADACRANGENNRETQSLKRLLFGTWEMNWINYGVATDLVLPETSLALPFLNQPYIGKDDRPPVALETSLPNLDRYELRCQRTLNR